MKTNRHSVHYPNGLDSSHCLGPALFRKLVGNRIKRFKNVREDVKAAIKFVGYLLQPLFFRLIPDCLHFYQGTGFGWLRPLGLPVDPLPFLTKSAEFAEFSMELFPPPLGGQSRLPSAGRLPAALPS
jgi:hypothetical protein